MITVLSILMIVLGFLLVVATVKERHDKKCGDGLGAVHRDFL